MELQQSPLYGTYITALKWTVIRVDGVQMFYKKIPFMGGLLKIQRPDHLPSLRRLRSVIATYGVRTVAIEPNQKQNIAAYRSWSHTLGKYCKVVYSSYMPTKTILINVKPDQQEIFGRFSESKRRAVRKAQKNGITVQESTNIKDLIRVKNKSGGVLGFITTVGIDKFWDIMAPKYATILLAYNQSRSVVGGVLLVFWGTTAFYWIAGATQEGKTLFAPTLLVWESLTLAKKRGAKQFDFLGVWDERKPNEHKEWKGFTRFKEGFGGTELYYPLLHDK